MALFINIKIKGQSVKVIPNVLSRVYKFAAFEEEVLRLRVTDLNGKEAEKRINVRNEVGQAWSFVTQRAARHRPCNDYFKTLLRKKTLQQILDEGDIVLHCLLPKEGHTFEELPDADTAGRDIAVNPLRFLDMPIALGPILIHELAHVAGATTNPRDKDAIAAERALKYCLCAAQFRPDALGAIQKIELPGYEDSRIA